MYCKFFCSLMFTFKYKKGLISLQKMLICIIFLKLRLANYFLMDFKKRFNGAIVLLSLLFIALYCWTVKGERAAHNLLGSSAGTSETTPIAPPLELWENNTPFTQRENTDISTWFGLTRKPSFYHRKQQLL